MAQQLASAGFDDYRRTDAALVRLLSSGPRSIAQIGAALTISRQAARKLVTGLERRGYASSTRDEHDARQLNVSLTARGTSFAQAITKSIDELNRTLAQRVDPAQLRAADAVLRASLPDQHARSQAVRLIPPPDTANDAAPPD